MAITKITKTELLELTSTTGAVRLPSGTTAERPSTNLNAGDFRYNTDDNKVEFYDGSNWYQIDDEGSSPIASENFNTVLWAGTDASHAITGVGFQPDLVWIKRRSSPDESHALYDSIRGVNKQLEANSTTAEATNTAPYEGFTSFDTDGFTVDNNGATNRAPYSYVGWCFNAGSGSAALNQNGDIDSNVKANTNAGFSIVEYTGNSSYGQTVGHGLGVEPKLVIIKNRSNARNWRTYVSALGATKYINLDESAAAGTYGSFNDTLPTINVFSTTSAGAADRATNYPNDDYIAYCYADVANYQKVGAYVGNGSTAGPIVTTGFEPAWVMIKNTTTAYRWYMLDNKRCTTNPNNARLFADTNSAEATNQDTLNFLTNGFEVITSDAEVNKNGDTMIYLAIASDPTSTTPTLANSFKTNLYTGTGGSQTIGGHLNGAAIMVGNGNIVLPNSTNFNGTSDLSISVWVFRQNTNRSFIADKANGGSGQYGWQLEWQSASAGFVFQMHNTSNTVADARTGPIANNELTWEHVVVTFNPSTFEAKIYYNGILCDTGTHSGTVASNSNGVTIGTYSLSSGFELTGSIDQFRFFDTVLTASQVSELYNETSSTANTLNFPTGAGCFAAYTFDTNANDLSGNYNASSETNITYYEGTSKNPSLVWIKSRSNPTSHELHDSVRGEPSRISSDSTAAASTIFNGFVSLFDNGFILDGAGSGGEVNTSGRTYVAWSWGSSSIGSINNNGTSQSIVQPHTNAGFSIVKYKGTGSSATIGHGLSAAPELIFTKTLDSIDNWMVLSTAVGATKKAALNAPNDFDVDSAPWDDTAPTATVFTVGTKDGTNKNGDELVAYCWHSISGYSKIGIYTGNNTTSNTIYTTDDGTSGGANGFEPGWLLIKRVDASANWRILDNTRSTSNPRDKELYPNLSNAEGTFSAANFNSNSFEIITTDTSYNALNGEYLYLVIK